MNEKWITCPMCGQTFNPAEHRACQACPLQGGCQLVCCPSCGYELVDVQKSALAQLAARLFFPDRSISPIKDPDVGGS